MPKDISSFIQVDVLFLSIFRRKEIAEGYCIKNHRGSIILERNSIEELCDAESCRGEGC